LCLWDADMTRRCVSTRPDVEVWANFGDGVKGEAAYRGGA
jgi:hypothetical protein